MTDHPTSFFGGLDLRIDPWAMAGEDSYEVIADTEHEGPDLLLDLEQPVSDWAPVSPRPLAPPSSLCFVDGVRRVDLRIVAAHQQASDLGLAYGCFGSYATGAVEVRTDLVRADYLVPRVGRAFLIGAGLAAPDAIRIEGMSYLGESLAENDPIAPQTRLHRLMRMAEELYARSLAQTTDRLVVLDGPLSFEDKQRGQALGLVKRLHELYLPLPLRPLLGRLRRGERTPLFHIGGRFPRYSWFLRLADTAPSDSPLSGLSRVEAHAALPLQDALALADLSASTLPAYAPGRHRDPRAPQNLLPIGALEQHLRRTLGDESLIRRRLEFLIRSPR